MFAMRPHLPCACTEGSSQSVAVSMGKVAAKLKPNFIVSTGDNFYDAGVESTKDPLWKDAWSAHP